MFLVPTYLDKCKYGIGVFANAGIRSGSLVYRTTPGTAIEINSKLFKELSHSGEQFKKYCYTMHGITYLTLDDGRYFNHAKTPNVVFSDTANAYIAAKDIKAGEELLVDYYDFCDAEDHNIQIIENTTY